MHYVQGLPCRACVRAAIQQTMRQLTEQSGMQLRVFAKFSSSPQVPRDGLQGRTKGDPRFKDRPERQDVKTRQAKQAAAVRRASQCGATYGCRTVLQIIDISISVRVRLLSQLNLAQRSWCSRAQLKRAHCAARGSDSMAPANIFLALLDSASIAHDVAKLEALKANAKTEDVRAPTSIKANGGTRSPTARRRRPSPRRPEPPPPPPTEKRSAPAGSWKGAARWTRRSARRNSRAAASTPQKGTTRRCSRRSWSCWGLVIKRWH